MKIKQNITILLGLLFLLTLVSCKGGGEAGEKFIGEWILDSVTSEGVTTDAEAVALQGVIVTLMITDDKKLELSFSDQEDMSGEGTWSAKDDTTIALNINGDILEVKLDGDLLIMEAGEAVMRFKK